MLDAEFIEMIIPDKLQSSKKKYRLTQKGKEWLEKNIVVAKKREVATPKTDTNEKQDGRRINRPAVGVPMTMRN